jgi:Xaa-Pro aminopeptidase
MLDLALSRGRQKRLLDVMGRRGLDLAVVTQREHVQWLTGAYIAPYFQPAAALTADGRLTLVAPAKKVTQAAADELLEYDAQSHSTMRNDQREKSTQVLLQAIAGRSHKNVGVEFSSFGQHLARGLSANFVDIEPDLYDLRRRKDDDELACLKKAIAATGEMYARARQIVRPGVNELDVFNELQSVAVRSLGERLTDTGNDYACRARGGPPRDRMCQAGELYIFDLGPAYRGYYSDNCRTLAVDGQPSREQQAAWQRITEALEIVREMVRPGVRCRAVFDRCNQHLNEPGLGTFDHHLGHGIGLFPHEAPHLNPNWDDVFEVGDVFTAEPGLYAPWLAAGIRLENDYLVTETGIELLSDFPLHL